MNLWKYKYFVDVVDTKSFTKAGKINYVSQTAISQQISSLEKNLGGCLLHRGNGGVEPTELGQIVYEKAKEILLLNDEMIREVNRFQEKSKIECGIDSSLNRKFWTRIEQMLDPYYPGHIDAFHFQKLDAKEGSRKFRDGLLDIYVGYELFEKKAENIDVTRLSMHPIGVYVGSRSDLYHCRKVTYEQLVSMERYESKYYPSSVPDLYIASSAPAYQEENVDTLRLKVEFNKGYAFVDSVFFDYRDGKILELKGEQVYSGLCAYYKKEDRNMKQIVSRLQSVLQQSVNL